ncbi:hypothetical protein, partial [Mesorhizobium sp.]|uniref:hypothetical protein n=1 Tax=Mesorhizobium sp. TaxID=1871066 RepID=UPI0025EFD75C
CWLAEANSSAFMAKANDDGKGTGRKHLVSHHHAQQYWTLGRRWVVQSRPPSLKIRSLRWLRRVTAEA